MVAEPLGLLQQKALGLERKPVSVEEVPGNQEGMHILAYREVHGPTKRLARRVPETLSDRLGASCEGGVEVDVGDVDEAHAPN
jgi:hypothetical protein